jgi:hypothetical protein
MAPRKTRLTIGDTYLPPGFVPQIVLYSSASKLVLQAPPGIILWTLDGDSGSVDYTWLVIPRGGRPGGGGCGGTGCPKSPQLSIGVMGTLSSNGAIFSVIGGRVLPSKDVQIRVELANSAQMTLQPHDAMWLVIVQRRGDDEGTAIRSVELLGADNSLIERQALAPGGDIPGRG